MNRALVNLDRKALDNIHQYSLDLLRDTGIRFPSDKALEYAVTINLDPKEKFCTVENLPKVRGILSWNNPPPPNDPAILNVTSTSPFTSPVLRSLNLTR